MDRPELSPEPSDVERSEWPDATHFYVQDLEEQCAAMEAELEQQRREKGDAIDHSLSLQRQVNELEAEVSTLKAEHEALVEAAKRFSDSFNLYTEDPKKYLLKVLHAHGQIKKTLAKLRKEGKQE